MVYGGGAGTRPGGGSARSILMVWRLLAGGLLARGNGGASLRELCAEFAERLLRAQISAGVTRNDVGSKTIGLGSHAPFMTSGWS